MKKHLNCSQHLQTLPLKNKQETSCYLWRTIMSETWMRNWKFGSALTAATQQTHPVSKATNNGKNWVITPRPRPDPHWLNKLSHYLLTMMVKTQKSFKYGDSNSKISLICIPVTYSNKIEQKNLQDLIIISFTDKRRSWELTWPQDIYSLKKTHFSEYFYLICVGQRYAWG